MTCPRCWSSWRKSCRSTEVNFVSSALGPDLTRGTHVVLGQSQVSRDVMRDVVVQIEAGQRRLAGAQALQSCVDEILFPGVVGQRGADGVDGDFVGAGDLADVTRRASL